MILVMVENPAPQDGYKWAVQEFEDLAAALIEAERAYKSGGPFMGVACVKVIELESAIVKAKWGPEDPGGVFNAIHDELPGR